MAQPHGTQRNKPRSNAPGRLRAGGPPPPRSHAAEQLLGLPEHGRVHQGGLLAVVDLVLVTHLARVQHVRQQPAQADAGKRLAAALLARTRPPTLVGPAPRLQLARHRRQRLVFQEQREHGPHPFGFLRVDRQPLAARVHVVAQHRTAARPLALATRGRDLVARPLGDDLPLELGEGQQHVEDQPAHRRGGVELLRDRNERDFMLLEGLHHAGEVEQRAAQAIDLIDDDAIDLAGFDVGHQTLESGPVHVAAGEAAVVVAVGQAGPAFAGLAADEGLGRLALGVEAVELLLQTLLRALARVNGAADQGKRGALGGAVGWVHRSPPFPVI